MITEDYVSFETAKLLKEKGFNEKCKQYYYRDNLVFSRSGICNEEFDSYNEVEEAWSAPTLQMAMKWLREVHNLEIYPYHNNLTIYNSKWWIEIIEYPNSVSEYESGKDEEFDTYEEACEEAIRYCLENLI